MSVYLLDEPDTDLAELATADLASLILDVAADEPEIKVPTQRVTSAQVSPSIASRSPRTPQSVKNAQTLEGANPAGDAVTRAFENLAIGIGAIESAAVAKFDALIEKLLAGLPRRGRHLSDEVSYSIHSFVGSCGPRHRLEAAPL